MSNSTESQLVGALICYLFTFYLMKNVGPLQQLMVIATDVILNEGEQSLTQP
jgi:hypothetical protein